MSFFKPAEPTRPREDGDTSDRPRQRRRTDAPQQPDMVKLKTQILEGHSSDVQVYSVSFSPDGTKVASGSSDKMVKLWDVTSGECLHTFEGHSDDVWSVSFSPDGTKVASGSYREMKLWDVTSGACLQTLEHYYSVGQCVVFSRWDEGCVGVW